MEIVHTRSKGDAESEAELKWSRSEVKPVGSMSSQRRLKEKGFGIFEALIKHWGNEPAENREDRLNVGDSSTRSTENFNTLPL